MADEDKNDLSNDFPDPGEHSSFGEGDYPPKSIYQTTHSTTTNNSQNSQPHPYLIVNPREENSAEITEMRKANRLTTIGLWVNGFLFLGTLGALVFAWISIAVTKDSVRVAKDALADSRKVDSMNRANDSVKSYRDSIIWKQNYQIDSTNTALTRKSVEAQINALDEERNQFLISNQPYLQITIPQLPQDSIVPGRDLIFDFTFKNLGNYPARISKLMFTLVTRVNNLTKKEIEGGNPVELGENILVTKEYPYEGFISFGTPLSPYQSQYLKISKWFFYIGGIAQYENLINNTRREYRFIIKWDLGRFRYRIIYSENRDV